MIDREELERLHEAATPGEWAPDWDSVDGGVLYTMISENGDAVYGEHGPSENDNNLIAYLRNAVPDILKLLDERDKFMWQVRDTCTRAEKAEAERDTLAAENAALTEKVERVAEALIATKQAARYRAIGDGYFDTCADHVEAVEAVVNTALKGEE